MGSEIHGVPRVAPAPPLRDVADRQSRLTRGGRRPRTGIGRCCGHHGELLQGVFEEPDGLHRGLVTLPMPGLGTRAEITLLHRRGSGEITVLPEWKVSSRRAAALTLRALGLGSTDARLRLFSDLPPSLGFGSSTSDVTATIRAVCDATGRRLPSRAIAQLAVSAERASDAVMFPAPVLFAHREGRILETFGVELPRMEVLGFGTGALGRHRLDTAALVPARYDAWEIETFRTLRGLVRGAVRRGDARALAAVATASADINQRHLPLERYAHLRALLSETAACGLQVAHSGAIAGLLFTPDVTEEEIDAAQAGLAQLGIEETWLVSSGEDGDLGAEAERLEVSHA
jgi:uncharacterized protein involved in propanediol utilization